MDKTLLKGLAVLEALALSEQPCGVTKLAQQLQMSKSNIHRLLQTLMSSGFVKQNPATERYELTLKVWEFGSKVMARVDLKRVAWPHLELLGRQTSETIHLSILDGNEVIYIDKIDGSLPIRSYTEVGGRAPAYCVATGKAMLAHQTEDVIDRLAGHLHPFTPKTVIDIGELRKELTRVRKLGYAINHGEWRESVGGVAAPIINGSGTVAGALGISGPTQRLRPGVLREMSPLVIQAADAISRDLGYVHPRGLDS
jgi:IclR family KDG regulon transcriptional repressor